MRFVRPFAVLGLMMLHLPIATAGLPPEAEAARKLEQMQSSAFQRASASEVVRLEVRSVSVTPVSQDSCTETLRWTASARITAVTRSATGLEEGDHITIQYDTTSMPPLGHGGGCGGPRRYVVAALQVGDRRAAWLDTGAEETYALAAGAWSLTTEDDFQQEFKEAARVADDSVTLAIMALQLDLEAGSAVEVGTAVRRYGGMMESCAQRAALSAPELEGTMTLTWSIADGHASTVSDTANTTGEPTLVACCQRKVQQWRFPSDARGQVRATYVVF